MLRLNFNVILEIEFVILNVRLYKKFMYIYIFFFIEAFNYFYEILEFLN